MNRKLTYTIMISEICITLLFFGIAYFLGWNPTQTVNKINGDEKPMFSEIIYGSFDQPLNKPLDVVKVDNKVYVTDQKNHQVQVFNPDGELAFKFGGPKEGSAFEYPYGISSDSKKQIYVTDTEVGKIYVFDKNGKFIKYFKGEGDKELPFNSPAALRIINDKMYVTDIKTGSFYIYNLKGKNLLTVDRQTVNGVQVMAPNGIYPDKDGNIFISDTGNDRVLKFNSKGKYLLTINGSKDGKGPAEFISQRGLGITDNDTLIIVDKISNRILGYDLEGKEKFKFGTSGADADGFSVPTSVFIDQDGKMYITDTGNDRIMVYN